MTEKIKFAFFGLLAGAFLGIIIGWVIHTPKVTQDDLNIEAKYAKKYADQRAKDEADAKKIMDKSSKASVKILYRNCLLDAEDFENMKEAFK